MSRKHHIQYPINHTLAIEQLTDTTLDPLFLTAKIATESKETITHHYQPVSTITNITAKLITNGHSASIESIEIAHNTIASITKKLGLENTTRLPALECFQNKHENRIAHNVAIEGIIDIIVNIWRAIKNALIRMWEAIKTFFRNIFDVSKQLERKIESLKKEVDGLGICNDKPTFTDDEITKAFTINNRFVISNVNSILDNQCEVTSDLNRLSGKLKEMTDSSFKAMKDITDNLKELSTPKQEPDTPLPNIDTQSHSESNMVNTNILINGKTELMINELRNGLVTLLNLRITSNTDNGLIGTSNKAFLYGKRLELSANKDGDNVELFMEITTPENDTKHAIAVLSISEMKAILASCSKLLKMESIVANTVTNLDKATNCLIKIIEQVEDTLVTINKDIELKENLVNASDSLQGFKLYVNSILSVINTVYTNVPIMNINAIKLALKLVEISASKYSRHSS